MESTQTQVVADRPRFRWWKVPMALGAGLIGYWFIDGWPYGGGEPLSVLVWTAGAVIVLRAR